MTQIKENRCSPMKGTHGGLTVAISDRYLLKFLLLSIVISQAANWDIYRCPTCSQVRFSRRIGGVFKPEVIAIIVEKLLRVRQRYHKNINCCRIKEGDHLHQRCWWDAWQLFLAAWRPPCLELDPLPTLRSVGHIHKLAYHNDQRVLTRLLVWITFVMLSTFSVFCSLARCKHSVERIFWKSRLSNSVSCRAISRGSISDSFNFCSLDFGWIGGGAGAPEVAMTLTGSPPLCWKPKFIASWDE